MKEEFENGAARSEKRLRYDLIPFSTIKALAERFTIGAGKFGDNNWKDGGKDWIRETKNHLIHHVWAYIEGDLEDEKTNLDHLRAALWNASALLWHEEKNENS